MRPVDLNPFLDFFHMFCRSEFVGVKPNDIHTKANKHKTNINDIETLHKCNECGNNNKIYWSEQERA